MHKNIHLHGMLCAIDTETTGLQPGFHEIWQVAILPLTDDCQIRKDVIPFYMEMKIAHPDRVEKKAVSLSKGDFAAKQIRAIDPWSCADLLDEWFERLKLPHGVKIIPLGQNWPFDQAFIREWLGEETYNQLFSYEYRDTKVVASFLNDVAANRCEHVPFPRVNLASLCRPYNIKNLKAHDALQDAIVTAQLYRELITKGYADSSL